MRTKLFVLSLVLILLISMTAIFSGCKEEQESEMEQPAEAAETQPAITEELEQDVQDVIKPIESKEEELKKGIDELLAEVDKKKQELSAREEKLEAKASELAEQALAIDEQGNKIRWYRTLSWVIMIIGAILFIVGIIFILIARKKTASQRAAKKTEKEQKKLTKTAEKAEKKTEKNLNKEPEKAAPAKKVLKSKPGTGK